MHEKRQIGKKFNLTVMPEQIKYSCFYYLLLYCHLVFELVNNDNCILFSFFCSMLFIKKNPLKVIVFEILYTYTCSIVDELFNNC